MTILVFGKKGQVGSELNKLNSVICLSSKEANFENAENCKKIIYNLKPKVVIIASAYTDVESAEKNVDLAMLVNAHTPREIALVCKKLDIPIIYISTDYVFDGNKKMPYVRDDLMSPLNVYGKSKMIGEQGVIKAKGKYIILRTSWIFSLCGNSFLNKIIDLSKKQKEIKIISDQVGGPTPAKSVALACHYIAKKLMEKKTKSGIYHFSGKPDISRADFASEIFKILNIETRIIRINSNQQDLSAKRPLNSRIDCSRIGTDFNIQRPDWRKFLKEILSQFNNE